MYVHMNAGRVAVYFTSHIPKPFIHYLKKAIVGVSQDSNFQNY